MFSDERKSPMMISAARHLRSVVRYLTMRKFINMSMATLEMFVGRSLVSSHPFYLRIGVSPLCNLRCPGCVLGGAGQPQSNLERRTEKSMSLDLFRESVRCFLPYLVKANLYDEGEPLLNTSLPAMIKHLNMNGIATFVGSNLSLQLSDEYLMQLLASGLDGLAVAVDGVTQESYARYRKGGDLFLVVRNIERLVAKKRETGADLQIEIQFLEFSHNRHERRAICSLAETLDVDVLTIVENCSPRDWEGKRFSGSQEERRRLGCYGLWYTATINSAGELGCCDYGEDHGIPGLAMASKYVEDGLRNHPTVVELRRSFKRGSPSIHPVCQHCSLARRMVANPGTPALSEPGRGQ